MARGFDDFGYFPPSRPREAKGGIRSRSRRGGFAESWWGRRWTEVLEGFGLGARLGRGKRYARQGQVLSIEVEAGSVTAKVQGSRARPYRVVIRLAPLSPDAWRRVVAQLGGQLGVGARLLAGELPPEVEEAFDAARVPLFPRREEDLATDCSCPDWSNPCKHIAAVHYLLAEEFDRDPFLLFLLRGMEREALVAGLTEVLGGEPAPPDAAAGGPGRAEGPGSAGGAEGGPRGPAEDPHTRPRGAQGVPGAGPEPPDEAAVLPTDPAAFWGTGTPPAGPDEAVELHVPPVAAALLRRLGDPPFWRGERPLVESLEPVYRAASEAALDLLSEEAET